MFRVPGSQLKIVTENSLVHDIFPKGTKQWLARSTAARSTNLQGIVTDTGHTLRVRRLEARSLEQVCSVWLPG